MRRRARRSNRGAKNGETEEREQGLRKKTHPRDRKEKGERAVFAEPEKIEKREGKRNNIGGVDGPGSAEKFPPGD